MKQTLLERLDQHIGKISSIGLMGGHPAMNLDKITEDVTDDVTLSDKETEKIGYIIVNYLESEEFATHLRNACDESSDELHCTKALDFVKGRIDAGSIIEMLKK